MIQKHYYSLNDFSYERFGMKVYRLSLDGGMTCPNRDGTVGTGGCTFCSAGGSGDFATGGAGPDFGAGADLGAGASFGTGFGAGFGAGSDPDIRSQIEQAKALVASKYKGNSFIAYFQSFTNTYAPVDYLRKIFTEAIEHPDIVCLSVATRPDCLDDEVIGLLSELNRIKPVWIELGLQTMHESTAQLIRRGYPLEVFTDAVSRLNAAGIEVIVHMIIGLPGETETQMYETASFLSHMHIQGIKLQLLHVLKGTDLADEYERGAFQTLSSDEYINILGNIIELLPKELVVHRLTGDGPKKLLISPLWSADKKKVLAAISRSFAARGIEQGKRYIP